MIPGDLLSAFPHRQFHTLPGLLDSWAALPNSNPNACVPMQGGSLYQFYDGLWYDPAGRRTHDLPCERRTRYRLSQPDTVRSLVNPLPAIQSFNLSSLISILYTYTVSRVTYTDEYCACIWTSLGEFRYEQYECIRHPADCISKCFIIPILQINSMKG